MKTAVDKVVKRTNGRVESTLNSGSSEEFVGEKLES
jgi:hypothetical protein